LTLSAAESQSTLLNIFVINAELFPIIFITIDQGSGTYSSRARCGSFDDGIWLAWYFLNTIVM